MHLLQYSFVTPTDLDAARKRDRQVVQEQQENARARAQQAREDERRMAQQRRQQQELEAQRNAISFQMLTAEHSLCLSRLASVTRSLASERDGHAAALHNLTEDNQAKMRELEDKLAETVAAKRRIESELATERNKALLASMHAPQQASVEVVGLSNLASVEERLSESTSAKRKIEDELATERKKARAAIDSLQLQQQAVIEAASHNAAAQAANDVLTAENARILEEKPVCCVCTDRSPSVFFASCAHLVVCAECNGDLVRSRMLACPKCQAIAAEGSRLAVKL